MRNFIYLACVLCLSAPFAACSGNECSASSDYLDDIDSDCVADASDNCVGTYNPDQFDGDEDEIGYACDADDTAEGSISAELAVDTEFNLAGFYEFENECGNFTSLSIEQSLDAITATDNSENNFSGLASTDSRSDTITGSIENANQTCDFVYTPANNVMNMTCDCEFTGEKQFTHLRIE